MAIPSPIVFASCLLRSFKTAIIAFASFVSFKTSHCNSALCRASACSRAIFVAFSRSSLRLVIVSLHTAFRVSTSWAEYCKDMSIYWWSLKILCLSQMSSFLYSQRLTVDYRQVNSPHPFIRQPFSRSIFATDSVCLRIQKRCRLNLVGPWRQG